MIGNVFKQKKSLIKPVTVDLGTRKIRLPICEIEGRKKGPRLLITAGADGDEYASIEAAYKLTERFKEGDFKGKLTIIPILNIPGFEEIKSINPLDGKYPKKIYPGRKNGTPSEKLIYWLDNNYLKNVNIWLDMHGGAIDEEIIPHVYIYDTKESVLNTYNRYFEEAINIPYLVKRKPDYWLKTESLAKKGTLYILTEAGESGQRNSQSVDKHIEWAKTVMGILGMIVYKPRKSGSTKIFTNTKTYTALTNGIWFPRIIKEERMERKRIIGFLKSYEGKIVDEYVLKNKGIALWWKEGMSVKRGDTLAVVGDC